VVHTFTFAVKPWTGLDFYRKIIVCWDAWLFNLVNKYQSFGRACCLAVRDVTMKTKTASVSETKVPHYRAAGFRVPENKNFVVTAIKTCLSFTEVGLHAFFLIWKKEAIKIRGNITSLMKLFHWNVRWNRNNFNIFLLPSPGTRIYNNFKTVNLFFCYITLYSTLMFVKGTRMF